MQIPKSESKKFSILCTFNQQILDTNDHIVQRELGFFLQSSEMGLPHPLTRRRVSTPPPLWFRGWDTLACGRGGGGGGGNYNEGTDTVALWYVVRTTGKRAESRERTWHNIHILQKKAEPQLTRKGRRYCLFICLTLVDLLCKVTRLTSPKGGCGVGVGGGGGEAIKMTLRGVYTEGVSAEQKRKSRKKNYKPYQDNRTRVSNTYATSAGPTLFTLFNRKIKSQSNYY
jgi:hypothetical protein